MRRAVADFIGTTTETTKTRHLSRPEDLRPFVDVPGRFGQSLCRVNNLGGVFDQARLDDLTRRSPYRKTVVIADLPLCKRCAKSAPASQESGNPA